MSCMLSLYETSYTEWKPIGLGVSGLVWYTPPVLEQTTIY